MNLINEIKSQFYETFNENLLTYLYMHEYLGILYRQEDNFHDFSLRLIENEYRKYQESGINIDNILGHTYLPTLLGRIVLRNFEKIDFNNFIKYQNRNFLQFFYTEIEHYFFKSFFYAFNKYPKCLNNKMIKFELILKNKNNIDNVIRGKIEKEVEQILRLSFIEIFRDINKKFGINPNIPKKEFKGLTKLRQIRNLYAHGDGTITQAYLDKVSDSKLKLGEIKEIDLKEIYDLSQTVFTVLNKFDEKLISKFPELNTSHS